MGISCAIVVAIFMVQRFGTGRVGSTFAPVVLIFFLCNLIIAITNISRYQPGIFRVSFVLFFSSLVMPVDKLFCYNSLLFALCLA